MFSYGPPHIAEQKQGDQLEPTYSSSVRRRDAALRTCQKRWTIERSGERGSGISVLAARHDDDDDDEDSWKMLTDISILLIDRTLNVHKCYVIIYTSSLNLISVAQLAGAVIHQLHHCRGVRTPKECPGYDTKQSDSEVPVLLKL